MTTQLRQETQDSTYSFYNFLFGEPQTLQISTSRLLSSQTIEDPGTYNITSGKTVIVDVIGEVTLNYGTAGDLTKDNIILPENVTGIQSLTITGFTSDSAASSLDGRKLVGEVELVDMIINVAIWGITSLAQIVFGFGDSPHTSGTVNTLIKLDNTHTIMITNVNQSLLTDANFIFATNSTNDGGDHFPLDLVLGLSIGLGVPAIAGCCAGCYYYAN